MPNINDIISNPSAERAILSIIFRNVDKLIECSSGNLFAEHFANKIHSTLYSVVCYLAEEGVTAFDTETIYSTIKNEELILELNNVGGRDYIQALLQSQIIQDNLNLYIKLVKECSFKRLVYNLGNELQESVITTEDTSRLLTEAQKKIMEIALEGQTDKDEYLVGSTALQRLIDRAENPVEVRGIRTGWAEFDRITQGLCGNDLIVIVAPSKVGKSTLLANICNNISIKSNYKGLYIDTEMSDEEYEDRLISMNSGIPNVEISNGMFARDTNFGTADDKRAKVFEATHKVNNGKITHVYMPDFTVEKVMALIRKHKIKNNIDYVVFDYIKVPTNDAKGFENVKEYQKLGFLTTSLKDMAGICGIPILTAAQSNRDDINGTNPDASDIGGSYRILQMASKLFFLRNKLPHEIQNEEGRRGNQKLHIAYQRNGEGGTALDFNFVRPINKMYEVRGS
ncbi:MAG: replicative DNA helicase [Clostridium sp.]